VGIQVTNILYFVLAKILPQCIAPYVNGRILTEPSSVLTQIFSSTEELHLMGCKAVWFIESESTFRKNAFVFTIFPASLFDPFLDPEVSGDIFLNVDKISMVCLPLYPLSQLSS
jgi:hypothetical protein